MNKEELIAGLTREFDAVNAWFEQQPAEAFENGPDGKWTAAQHLDHLVRSAKPLNQALRLPKIALRKMFGKPDRASQSFDGVVATYKEKLDAGGAASGQFVPKESGSVDKADLQKALAKEGDKLVAIAKKWDDADMDKHQLPHPLIGNMTVREMLQFTIYHMQHHLNALNQNYK